MIIINDKVSILTKKYRNFPRKKIIKTLHKKASHPNFRFRHDNGTILRIHFDDEKIIMYGFSGFIRSTQKSENSRKSRI